MVCDKAFVTEVGNCPADPQLTVVVRGVMPMPVTLSEFTLPKPS